MSQTIHHGVDFAPMLPWAVIAGLAVTAAMLLMVIVLKRGRGWVFRAFALGVLIAGLANPSIVREEREARPDLALIVVDDSASQRLIDDRKRQTDQALDSVESALRELPELETRVIRVGEDPGGTRLFSAVEAALVDEPAARLGGVIMMTDGQVHDVPDRPAAWPFDAPVHALLSGRPGEVDRRIVIEQAPAYGLIGEPVGIAYRIEDRQGPGTESTDDPTRSSAVASDETEAEEEIPGQAIVHLRIDGVATRSVAVPVGEPQLMTFTARHAGPTLVELEVEGAPEELSPVNNRAVVTINGVRDRLKVLLVSGQPHLGERMWRNLLKSDPSVDLVHFTILRPPDKDDLAPINELSLIAFPVRELFEEQLYNFDLIVFDRYVVRSVLPWRYLEQTAQYLRDGGAILLDVGPEFASYASLYQTPLGTVMPGTPTGRILEEAFKPQVTDLGHRHPVTASLPGEAVVGDADGKTEGEGPVWGRWFRLIEAEATSGDILMNGASDRPLLIVDRVEKGRIAQLLSDQIWLWARGYEGGGPHAELIRRLVHWLMKEPELEEERLEALVDGNRLVIERRSLSLGPVEVTVIAPDGDEETVRLDPGSDGIGRAEVPVSAVGLYRVEDGAHTALAVYGPPSRKEVADLAATAERIAPVVARSGGGIAWIADGVPEFRRTLAERDTAGRGWLGLRRNQYAVVSGVKQVSLLPPLLVLALTLAALVAAWWRESR